MWLILLTLFLVKLDDVWTGGVEMRSKKCVVSRKEMGRGDMRACGLVEDCCRFIDMGASRTSKGDILEVTKEVTKEVCT